MFVGLMFAEMSQNTTEPVSMQTQCAHLKLVPLSPYPAHELKSFRRNIHYLLGKIAA